MRILVQKFGGTSLSTRQARSEAARHIARALEEGYAVVVVVSAMGRYGDPYATDSLLDLIRQNGGSLPRRETDLLLSCGELIAASVMCSLLSSRNTFYRDDRWASRDSDGRTSWQCTHSQGQWESNYRTAQARLYSYRNRISR